MFQDYQPENAHGRRLSKASDQVDFPDETHVRLKDEPSLERVFHRLKHFLI